MAIENDVPVLLLEVVLDKLKPNGQVHMFQTQKQGSAELFFQICIKLRTLSKKRWPS